MVFLLSLLPAPLFSSLLPFSLRSLLLFLLSLVLALLPCILIMFLLPAWFPLLSQSVLTLYPQWLSSTDLDKSCISLALVATVFCSTANVWFVSLTLSLRTIIISARLDFHLINAKSLLPSILCHGRRACSFLGYV